MFWFRLGAEALCLPSQAAPIDYSADFALPEVVEDTGTPPPGTPPAELAQDLRVLSDDALEDVP